VFSVFVIFLLSFWQAAHVFSGGLGRRRAAANSRSEVIVRGGFRSTPAQIGSHWTMLAGAGFDWLNLGLDSFCRDRGEQLKRS
jgi:hypothetical protein